MPDAFTIDTAKKTNLSERTVRQDLQLAKALDEDVKKEIKDKKISKGEALRIARLKKEEQQKAVEERTEKPVNKKQRDPIESGKGFTAQQNIIWDYRDNKITYGQAEELLSGIGEPIDKVNKRLEIPKEITKEKILKDFAAPDLAVS